MRESLMSRLVDKTEFMPNGCIVYTGTPSQQYGLIKDKGKMLRVHRVSYEGVVGPIPDGLTIDHLCRTPRCVNPHHMEPVTIGVNTGRGMAVSAINKRKTACIHGHAFTEANTYAYFREQRPRRGCRVCLAENRRRWSAKAIAKAKELAS